MRLNKKNTVEICITMMYYLKIINIDAEKLLVQKINIKFKNKTNERGEIRFEESWNMILNDELKSTSMTPIDKIQEKLLEILLYFQRFCNEHGLSFTLAGGTCLGAVRHEGFIPWDDDVDVFMLREDYERLAELWERFADTEHYSCVRSNDKINIHHSATEIKDNYTTFINKHSVNIDINHGLMIDVIPLDNVASGKFNMCRQHFYSMLYCCFNFQRMPEHNGKLTYICTGLALGVVKSFKLRYKIWKYAEKRIIALGDRKNGLAASFGEGAKIMRQHFPREWFEKPAYLKFAGHEMPVPQDYDRWLTMSYGDYMKLPPVSERVFRHNTVFIDLEHGYTRYKGIYYCRDEQGGKSR